MTTHAPASQGLAVDMTGLRRSYGDVHALDGLDLHIEPAEMVVLLGPSGCGKTTALRILAGLERQDAGTISVGGRDLSSVSANKRDMGMVFQAYSLFPHLTVLDNVAFGLELRGRSRSDRRSRAGDMLDLVGLAAHKDRYANQLSGGQQQRVALARALAIEPAVLLLDEPLSALDAKVRVQLRDEIRRVQLDVGTTTLFVTHDQEEALAIADRVGVMNAGRLEQLRPRRPSSTTPRRHRSWASSSGSATGSRRASRATLPMCSTPACRCWPGRRQARASPWSGPRRSHWSPIRTGTPPSPRSRSWARSRARRRRCPTGPWWSPSSPARPAMRLAIGERVRVEIAGGPVLVVGA